MFKKLINIGVISAVAFLAVGTAHAKGPLSAQSVKEVDAAMKIAGRMAQGSIKTPEAAENAYKALLGNKPAPAGLFAKIAAAQTSGALPSKSDSYYAGMGVTLKGKNADVNDLVSILSTDAVAKGSTLANNEALSAAIDGLVAAPTDGANQGGKIAVDYSQLDLNGLSAREAAVAVLKLVKPSLTDATEIAFVDNILTLHSKSAEWAAIADGFGGLVLEGERYASTTCTVSAGVPAGCMKLRPAQVDFAVAFFAYLQAAGIDPKARAFAGEVITDFTKASTTSATDSMIMKMPVGTYPEGGASASRECRIGGQKAANSLKCKCLRGDGPSQKAA